MQAAASTKDPRAKDLAQIHVAIKQVGLSHDDHKALLQQLFGQDSSGKLNQAQRRAYLLHLQKLGFKPRPTQGSTAEQRAAASPLERKAWALWGELGRSGKLSSPTPAGFRAFVERQTGMTDPRFCNQAQLHSLVETLKMWGGR
jgi:hypothetical protein